MAGGVFHRSGHPPLVALPVLDAHSSRVDAALSAPALLFLPLATMLSILRLKAMVSRRTGLGAAGGAGSVSTSRWSLAKPERSLKARPSPR